MVDESNTLRSSGGTVNEAVVAGIADTSCLEGLSASELAMIHRLAGDDPIVRKRTMRKLRKWLRAIASKIPDSPESRNLVDPNFVRVWKALFYCMWMADKPLPQEQLAEQMSNLLSIFSRKQNILIIFIDWFFLTVAREWSWIDHFRHDKFMMLIRRFLRKTLEQLSLSNWNKDILTQFVQIISIHIFNRHPPMKQTRARAKIPEPPKAPLGFQNHFTNIFLEELAKVGAATLKSEDTLELLSPFIFELTHNEDDELLAEIHDTFIHLIKQSDAAIDRTEGDVESSDNEGQVEMDENDNDGEDKHAELQVKGGDDEETDQPLDPRAGQVDVILPQLQISYGQLAMHLEECSRQDDVRPKNQEILLALTRSINKLAEGGNPLALPESGPRAPTISKKEVQIATERLASLDDELIGNKTKKKTRKERRREQKQLSQEILNENSNDSVGSEDHSAYLADEELVDHVGDNYLSYLEEMKVSDEVKVEVDSTSPKNATDAQEVSREEKKTNKKRLRSEENGTNGEEIAENSGMGETKTKKAKLVLCAELNSPLKGSTENGTTPVSDFKLKKLKVKRNDVVVNPNNMEAQQKIQKPQETNKCVDMLKGLENKTFSPAQKTPNISRTSLPISTTPYSPLKKGVSFVLARNSEHPHSDYQDSIRRSPAIPYDSKKQPNGGLLKSKSPLAKPTLKGYVIPKKKKISF